MEGTAGGTRSWHSMERSGEDPAVLRRGAGSPELPVASEVSDDSSTRWIEMELGRNRIQRWETDLAPLRKAVRSREMGRKDEAEGTGGCLCASLC